MIIAFSGPSGIGKGYMKELFLMHYPQTKEIVWLTTRPLRESEKLTSNRINVSCDEFEQLRRDGQLVLVQSVFKHYYGVYENDLLPTNLLKLTELHPYVVHEALDINSSIVTIGLVTADLDLLRERLSIRRKTEDSAEIAKRVAAAEAEMRMIRENNNLYTAILEVARENEHTIFEELLAVLNLIITERGG